MGLDEDFNLARQQVDAEAKYDSALVTQLAREFPETAHKQRIEPQPIFDCNKYYKVKGGPTDEGWRVAESITPSNSRNVAYVMILCIDSSGRLFPYAEPNMLAYSASARVAMLKLHASTSRRYTPHQTLLVRNQVDAEKLDIRTIEADWFRGQLVEFLLEKGDWSGELERKQVSVRRPITVDGKEYNLSPFI